MRTLSRHLPPNPIRQRTWLDNAITGFIWGFGLLVFLIFFYFHPLTVLAVVAVAAVGYKILELLGRRFQTEFETRMSQRAGENICSFRRAFDLRRVDPWIVRAVYEEVQETVSYGMGKVDWPIRAEDRLEKDLLIEVEDWEGIVSDVATRAGYDLADYERNPLYGKIQTVGDLVMFFTHQRRIRA